VGWGWWCDGEQSSSGRDGDRYDGWYDGTIRCLGLHVLFLCSKTRDGSVALITPVCKVKTRLSFCLLDASSQSAMFLATNSNNKTTNTTVHRDIYIL
jgi:hypothetical protein